MRGPCVGSSCVRRQRRDRPSGGPCAGGLTDEVVALGDVRGPTGGLGVRRSGGGQVTVELVQVAAHGVPALPLAEHLAQPVGLAQPDGGADDVADRDRAAEHGGGFSVLWHTDRFDPGTARGWDRLYLRLLAAVRERGGVCLSAGELARDAEAVLA